MAVNVPEVEAAGGPGPPPQPLHGADLCPRSPAGAWMDPVVLAADLPTPHMQRTACSPAVGAGHRSWVSCVPGGPPGPQQKHQSIRQGSPQSCCPESANLGNSNISECHRGQGQGVARAWASWQQSHTTSLCPPRRGPSSRLAKADRPCCGAPGLNPAVITARAQPGWSQRQLPAQRVSETLPLLPAPPSPHP